MIEIKEDISLAQDILAKDAVRPIAQFGTVKSLTLKSRLEI
jgi:hypothetical protein